MDRITAPFTAEQAAALNRRQYDPSSHPYTCPRDHLVYWGETEADTLLTTGRLVADAISADHIRLVATVDGWRCPAQTCDYTQDWAHAPQAP